MVNKDAKFLKFFQVFVYVAHATGNHLVIRFRRRREKFNAAFFQFGYSVDDVFGGDRYVLHAFIFIKIQIFFHLRFFLSLRRLVDWEFRITIAVAHHFGHQRGIFCVNLLIIKTQNIHKTHHIFVPIHHRNHPVPAYISHTMIHVQQSNFLRIVATFPFLVARHKIAIVIFSFYKHMHRFAIGVDAGHAHFAMFIGNCGWFQVRLSAAFRGFFKSIVSIVHPKCENFHAVAMFLHMFIYVRI